MKKYTLLTILTLFYLGVCGQILDTVSFSSDEVVQFMENGYTRVFLSSCETTEEVGAPELPCLKLKYILPYQNQISSIIVIDSTKTMLSNNVVVYPKQPEYSMDDTTHHAFISPNREIYEGNQLYPPQVVEVSQQYYNKGYKIVTICVYPIRYSPTENKLELYTSLRFQINTETSTTLSIRPEAQPRYMYDLTEKIVRSQIRNKSTFSQCDRGPLTIIEPNNFFYNSNKILEIEEGVVPEYIIITNNYDVDGLLIESADYPGLLMTDVFKEFADWKTQKGIPAKVVTIDEISANYSGSDTQEKIHNFLADVYRNYGSLFVLFGGDTNIVPERMMYYGYQYYDLLPSDLYYVAVESTWNANNNALYGEPDDIDKIHENPLFYYGRASVENVSEARIFVEKSKYYENMTNIPVLRRNYVNNIVSMAENIFYARNTEKGLGRTASYYNLNTGNIFSRKHFGIIQNNIEKWRLYKESFKFIDDSVSIRLIENSWDWENRHMIFSKDSALACFGSRIPLSSVETPKHGHFVFHLDHSSYLSMGISTQIMHQAINRNDVDGFSNAPYYQIVYTGGCCPGEYQKDCITEHFLNNPNGGAVAMFASSSVTQSDYAGFVDMLKDMYYFVHNNDTTSPHIYTLGALHDSNLAKGGLGESLCKRRHHLFGDPELPVWTREPVDLTVSITPSVITNLDDELTVSVRGMAYSEYTTNDVMVCIMKDGDVYLREHYDGTAHNHDFVFDVNPETSGSLTVTVTGHNYIPFQTTVPVSITGKNVYISEKLVIDNTGNSDGRLDAGENDYISIALTNNGTVSLTDVTATLSCEFLDGNMNQNINDYLTIVTSTAYYGTIAQNSTVTRDNFQLVLSNTIPDRTPLRCTLTIGNGTGTIATKSFMLLVGAAEIEYVSLQHKTNQNGRIGLDITLDNWGFGTAKGIVATLTSTNDIQITQRTASYGAMGHLEAKTQSFEFVPSGNIAGVPFTLTVEDAYHKSWSFDFTLENVMDTVENLTFEAKEHSIKLKWDPVIGSRGYYIYRSATANSGYERLNSHPVPSSAYPDMGLEAKQIYYYGVSYLDEDGNESAKARITAWTSLPVTNGWPVEIPDDLGRVWNAAPNVADVNGDGKQEIFLTTGDAENERNIGAVLGFNCFGEELYDIDHNPTTVSGFANPNVNMTCTPAIGDIDNDGVMEFVVATRDLTNSGNHCMYVFKDEDADEDGIPDLAWRNTLDFRNFNGVVLADLDDDGMLEIIAPNQGKSSGKTLVEVFGCTGDTLFKIRVPFTYNVDEKAVTMPIVADLDNDGYKEIVFGLEGGVYLWSCRAGQLGTLVAYNSVNEERMDCPVIATDIDGDGDLEVLYMAVKGDKGYIRAVNSDSSSVNGWSGNSHFVSLSNTSMDWVWPPYFSVADIDNNGSIEVFVADKDTLKMWSGDGTTFGNGKIFIPNLDCQYFQPVIADVDGNGDCEIIIPSHNGYIHAYKPNGNAVPGWPLAVDGLSTIPVVADIDGDGYNEVVAASEKEVYVWHTEGESRYNHCDRFRYNKYNNAVYAPPCSHSRIPAEITGNQAWNDDRHIGNDVIVNNGACLTVKSELQFSENSRIIVKPGGRLILDGGVLTNACPGELWPGVEVWGDSTMHQYPVNGSYRQGYLELRNGAVIENAICAVELCRPGYAGTTGGIVIADSAVFRNNAKTIHALNYTNHLPTSGSETPYVASFQNCTFVIDSAYLGTATFLKHADLYHVNGVSFKGCSFSVDPNALNVSPLNNGIYAYDAGFNVSGWCRYNNGNTHSNICPDGYLVRSAFMGFHDAVYATGDGGAARSFSVTSSVFQNNDRGVFTQNTGYATILNNEFRVGSRKDCSYGVYMKSVTGFCIEENTFTSLDTRSVNFGIGVFDCSADNDIYLNSFSGLDCGNIAVGVNTAVMPGPPVDLPMSGLTYSCNQNTGNAFDFCVLKDGDLGGIKAAQGSSTTPAGNTFGGSSYHFYNDGVQYVNYYYDAGETGQTPDPTKLYHVSRISTTNTNSCLSHYGLVSKSSQELEELEDEFLSAREAYYGLARIYMSRLDGGNTPAEIAELTNATPSDAQRLRTRLLGLSPYLSREVLTAAADRDDVFSDPVLFEILASNPDELKKDTLINYLEHRNPPLPGYMIGLLQQIASGATPRTVLTAQMVQYEHNGSLAAGDIVRSILNDSVANPQELRSWLGNMGEIASDRMAIASYIQEGDYESAFELAALLPELYELSANGLKDHLDYMRLLGLFRSLHMSGRTTAQLMDDERRMVDSIADGGTGFSKSMAEAIRENYVGEPRADYPCPDLPATRGMLGNLGISESDDINFSVAIAPNPATSQISINYVLPEEAYEALFEITNILGVKMISVALDGRNGIKDIYVGKIPSGIYNYTVRCGSNVLNGKLIITH